MLSRGVWPYATGWWKLSLFARRSSREPQIEGEVATLRQSIRHRGQAQIPEATIAVDSFVGQVLARAGAQGNDEARVWVLDRIRLFIVAVVSPQLFDLLKRFPEFPELHSEYRVLVRDPDRYGSAHLVAWWWLLQRSLFEPLLQEQFRQMEGSLVDGVRNILVNGGVFASQLTDWSSFSED